MFAPAVSRILGIYNARYGETVIAPPKRWVPLNLAELWSHRELLYFLTWRDIKVRYKQTVLGVAWAVIQPLATMLVLTLFFGEMAKMSTDGVPYPIFSFAALLPWTFFASGISLSANSLVGNSNLITKVYFPRLLVPVASIMAGLVDLVLASVVLFGLMFWYDVGVTPRIVWLPLPTLLATITALGTGLWLSALNVQFRDVRHTVPFLCQLWMFATPVVYPSSLLSERWQTWSGLNPMTSVVECYRWSLLGTAAPSATTIGLSVSVGLVMLITGAWYFRSMERSFADVI